VRWTTSEPEGVSAAARVRSRRFAAVLVVDNRSGLSCVAQPTGAAGSREWSGPGR
jgi:hypothetical protein